MSSDPMSMVTMLYVVLLLSTRVGCTALHCALPLFSCFERCAILFYLRLIINELLLNIYET